MNNNGGGTNNNVPPLPAQPQQHSSHQNSPVTNGTPTSDVSGAAGQQTQTHSPYVHDMTVNNQQDQQQPPHPQHSQPPARYSHREGTANESMRVINLPPGTRIHQSMMPTDAAAAAISSVQQQDTNTGSIYGHGHQLYQQTAPATTLAGYIQAGYGAATQMAQHGQYYTAAPYNQYYTNSTGSYALTPQALIMQQSHAQAQAAAYQQILGQSHQGVPNSHAHQMIATSQQQQPGGNIPATSVPHMQQGNLMVTSAGGNVTNTSTMQTTQMPPPPQQAAKPKKILQFFDPDSGEALKLGTDSKSNVSTTSAVASDEDNKSAVIKTEFLKKVSERVMDEAGTLPAQTRRSPSSFAGSDALPPQQSIDQSPLGIIPKSASGADLFVESGGGFEKGVSPPVQIQHAVHHQMPPTTMVPSMPIPIEHHSPTPIMHHHAHSPHNLPSILEIKVSQPSPQPQLQAQLPQRKEEEAPAPLQQQPSFGVVISPTMDEQKITGIDLEEKQQQSEKRVSELVEQEVNGGDQSLTPTEGAEDTEMLSEEKIRQLEAEMQKFEEIHTPTHDPDEMIYNRSFLMFLRKFTQIIKIVKCPKTEEELEDLGLSKRGMPVNQINIGGKTKRFDMAGGDSMFKPSWQQQGGGGGPQYGGGTRFPSGRPPNYMGRHSDNKMKQKKGPMVGRPSLDQRQPIKLAQINQQDVALPKKSANAWKSKREERFDMNAPQKDEEGEKYEKLRKEIRGLLNKITPSTYEELSNDFCNYKINEDSKLLTPIIDLIFDKAVEEPHFCPLYSDLCKKQVEVERHLQGQAQRDKTPDGQQTQQQAQKQKEKNFRNEIILKCQRTFLASSEYDKKMKELDDKIKGLEESDDKGRAQIEEELEMHRSKEKRRLLGIIKFIGQLYRHQLLVEAIIDWCAIELIKRYQATFDEVYIEYAVELVETVGKIYEQRREHAVQQQTSRQAQQRTAAQIAGNSEQKQEYRLEMVFSHLSQLKPSVSNRVRFAIMDLEDLRKCNWLPRGGEKGPKTIEEVREEVEKEQQENEMERIEHEKQREKDKLQPLRKSSARTGYGGRSSADRRQAAAASSLLSRESKAESRIIGINRLSDLDNMTTIGRKAWMPQHRDRTPQKDGGGSGPGLSSGSGVSDAWRSNKSGTDSPKEE